MLSISTIVLMMSAICFYSGFYHLWMFTRRTAEKENLYFAFTCFSIACYEIFCAGLYHSGSVTEGLFYQRLQFASLDLFCIFITFFTFSFINKNIGKLFIVIIIWFGLLLIAGLVIRGELTLTAENPSIKEINIQNIIHITYNEAEPGFLYTIQYISMIILMIFATVHLIRFYVQKSNKFVRPIIFSFILFYLAAFNDTFVGMKLYPFIYVLEYIYLIIILSMAYMLLNKFVHLHEVIKHLNQNLEKKVEARTRQLKQANLALWSEMKLAKKLQTILIPKKPKIKGFQITGYMKTAEKVGGDYYDVINYRGSHWIVIGDVSGHGVSAGLIMMLVQNSIHTVLLQNPRLTPRQVLILANRILLKNIKKFDNNYMTLTLIASCENNTFHYSGAHLDLIIYRKKTGTVDLIPVKGVWLGLSIEIGNYLEDYSFMMEEGDILLLYTDGLTESWRKNRVKHEDIYDVTQLKEIFMNNGNRSTDEIRDAIISSLADYESDDDISMLIIKKESNTTTRQSLLKKAEEKKMIGNQNMNG